MVCPRFLQRYNRTEMSHFQFFVIFFLRQNSPILLLCCFSSPYVALEYEIHKQGNHTPWDYENHMWGVWTAISENLFVEKKILWKSSMSEQIPEHLLHGNSLNIFYVKNYLNIFYVENSLNMFGLWKILWISSISGEKKYLKIYNWKNSLNIFHLENSLNIFCL